MPSPTNATPRSARDQHEREKMLSSRADASIAAGRRHSMRWRVLAMTCVGLFGQFYAYDNPSTLFNAMKQRFGHDEHFDIHFSMLYSLYSFPNIVLPLVCGILIDRVGIKVSVLALATCVVTGAGLVALGCRANSWTLMLCGRALFGIGGESLQVAQNALLFSYFEGAEIALALGLNLSIARMGSSVNAIVTPWIATLTNNDPVIPFLVGFVLCAISGLANFGSVWGEKLTKAADDDEEVSLGMITRLPRHFWYLCALCVLMYGAILPFNNIAQPLFVATTYSNEEVAVGSAHASRAAAWMFIISAFATPIFGHFVDKFGQRTILLAASATILAFTHGMMLMLSPYMASFQLGSIYTVFAAALWPSIALTVAKNCLGTAYGVTVSLQNIGLALIPLLVGDLQQRTEGPSVTEEQKLAGYGEIEKFFTFIGLVSTGIAWALHFEAGPLSPLVLPSGAAVKGASPRSRKQEHDDVEDDSTLGTEIRPILTPKSATKNAMMKQGNKYGADSTTASDYGSSSS